jgi:hypothetical protein
MEVRFDNHSFAIPKESSIKVNGKKTPFKSIKPLGSGNWELIF